MFGECQLCGKIGPTPCGDCEQRLLRAEPPNINGATATYSLLSYVDLAKPLISGIKYKNKRAALSWLAWNMIELLDDKHREVDLVTWIPTNRNHIHARGVDHGKWLAQQCARALAKPLIPTLMRTQDEAQTGKTRAERLKNPKFFTIPGVSIAGARVLVVDDVLTTGATMGWAAHALRAAGAMRVIVLTAAATPRLRAA